MTRRPPTPRCPPWPPGHGSRSFHGRRVIKWAGAILGLAVVAAACGSGSSESSGETVPTTSPDAATSSGPGGASPAGSRGTAAGGVRLTDVAGDVGLDFTHGAFRWDVSADPAAMMGGGVCWLDFDDDGWTDLFAVNSHAVAEAARWRDDGGGLPRTALFRNVAGEFTDVSAETGADLALRGNGCVAADFDLDGHTDLYVTASGVSALLWNDGDGGFREGAVEAGVAASGWHTGATVGDVDGNGWPDLFVAGYADVNTPDPDTTQGFPHTYRPVRDLLYLNEGPTDDGRPTFREFGEAAGLEPAGIEHGLGAVFTDVDGDGRLDLYVANDASPNRLYLNRPRPDGTGDDAEALGFRFDEVAASTGVDDPNAGMGITVGDYDGDSRGDLVVTNAHGQPHAAFRSQPPGVGSSQDEEAAGPRFVNVAAELGVDEGRLTGWGVSWADLDLDGQLDLFVANGNVPVTELATDAEPLQLFSDRPADPGRADAPSRFEEIGTEVGLDEVGDRNARGAATADYDNDGDLDIALGSIGGRLALLRNDGATGHWLTVQLDRFDPGAVVTATLPDGREVVREARAGSSYLSSEDPRLHFGLGDTEEVARLAVRWTDGTETVLRSIAADQFVTVESG